MSDAYLPVPGEVPSELIRGRSVFDGYARGAGLEFGDVAQSVQSDPLYLEAMRVATGRTIQGEMRRMNIFLLLKFFVPKLPPGDIIEFGSYRGGSAMFMAKCCAELGLDSTIWALDTFAGMPPTDKSIDAHNGGDFADVDLDEIREHAVKSRLTNIEWIKGPFEATLEGVLWRARRMVLAHIDCDIRSAVSYSYNRVKQYMVSGSYMVFDYATASSCLGSP